jgi:hypothetical protein
MDAGGARLRAVGERLKQIGQLGVAVLFHEARQFVASRVGHTARRRSTAPGYEGRTGRPRRREASVTSSRRLGSSSSWRAISARVLPPDAPEHVIENDVFIEAEIIEQPRRRSLKAHHRRLSHKSAGFNESRRGSDDNQSPTFSTVSAQSGRPQRLRRARLGPVVGGPDSKVLIEILDRLAAHAEALAPSARSCVCGAMSAQVG